MINYRDNIRLQQWMRLAFSYGVGPMTALKLIQAFQTIDNIFKQDLSSLTRVINKGLASSILGNNEEAIEKALLWQENSPSTRHFLTLEDPLYPLDLAQIANPPILLFAEGNLDLLKTPKLAIVGTRHPSAQGLLNAKSFAEEIARQGMTIVSGLALGIDRAAHEGALQAKNNHASTIAIIGTGIDVIYPASNREVFATIRQEGLILSEFALGTQAQAQNFPRRNRVIIGLSKACLVIESGIDGGSMISANFALEMGRDVMAIPGSIHNPMARGCHKLIKQGAKLIETVADVLDEFTLNPVKSLTQQSKTLENDSDPVLNAMGYDPETIDSLCNKLSIDFAELCGKLLELELAGLINNCGGGRYQRIFKQGKL